MLLNYAELALVLTPLRYCAPTSFTFDSVVFKSPRQRSRKIRSWLVENFQLTLDPPVCDGYTDENRLSALLLKSLSGQIHLLWHSVKHRPALGVMGEMVIQGDQERQITSVQVLSAINKDLADFPGFSMDPEDFLKPPPLSYCFPAAPKSSRYAVRMKVSG